MSWYSDTGTLFNSGKKLAAEISNVYRYENDVDRIEIDIREKYISRLLEKECNIESGVLFIDIIGNLERISDHALNIAQYVEDENK